MAAPLLDDAALVHLHPALAVVGDPPVLWHVTDGWEDPLPSPMLAGVLRQLCRPTSVRHALVAAGVTATADAHDLRRQLAELRDQSVLLPGPPPQGAGGLFATPRTTIGAALADDGTDAVVVGMPYDVGTTVRAGTRHAPEQLRAWGGGALVLSGDAGAWDPGVGRTVLAGIRVVDVGDIDAAVHTRNGATFDRLRRLVRWTVAAGAVPVVVGGDHSIAHAVTAGIAAALDGPHAVVQLDAHTDRGGSGGDWRVDLHHGNVGDHLLATPSVAALVQVGVRQRTPTPPPAHERATVLPARGLDPAAVLAHLPAGVPVHLSIDVDVLDPTVVRGTGAPVPGGLSLAEVVAVVEAVAAARPVVAIDCCELIPDDDPAGTLAVAELLARTLVAVLDPPSA